MRFFNIMIGVGVCAFVAVLVHSYVNNPPSPPDQQYIMLCERDGQEWLIAPEGYKSITRTNDGSYVMMNDPMRPVVYKQLHGETCRVEHLQVITEGG